jgi:hypothetical protein
VRVAKQLPRAGHRDAGEQTDREEGGERLVEQADPQHHPGRQPEVVIAATNGPDDEPGDRGPGEQVERRRAEQVAAEQHQHSGRCGGPSDGLGS